MKSSLVTEFNLVCDREYHKVLNETLYFLGIAIGMCLGVVADVIGRKKSIIIFSIPQACNALNIHQYFIVNGVFRSDITTL